MSYLRVRDGLIGAVRDSKREGMLVGGTNKKHVVKYEVPVSAPDDTLAVRPSSFSCHAMPCHSKRWMPEHASVEERVEPQLMESKDVVYLPHIL